ncbi:MAG: hypothetical protein ACUVTD_07795 [Nitrososphaerales archaeon]
MATVKKGNDQPWAASVYYAEEGLNLYYIVENFSIKFNNIKQNPKVAFTIDRQVH